MTTRKKNAAGKNKTSVKQPITTAFCTQNKGSGTEKSAKRKMKSAKREDQNASIEEQIALLESQIALLQAQSAECKMQSEDANQNHSALCASRSALHASPSLSPSAPLAPPELESVTAIGSQFLRVSWKPVAGAKGYVIQWGTNVAITSNSGSRTVASSVTEGGVQGSLSAFVSGLAANTTYYVHIRAVSDTGSDNSDFSASMSAKTGIAGGDDNVMFLQSWLGELQTLTGNFTTLLPQLETTELNTADRMRLNGSGVRRYGFIEKTADISGEFPQFWPAFGGGTEELTVMVREIEVLRNLLVWFRWGARVAQDLLLLTGDEAFRLAGSYYTAARDGARRRNPEAQQVFHMLQLFWNRRRRTSDEPTEQELERDFRALLRGTKDGEIIVKNESDSIVKGEKVIIDNTQRKPRGGVKVVEKAEGNREF